MPKSSGTITRSNYKSNQLEREAIKFFYVGGSDQFDRILLDFCHRSEFN